MKTLSPIELTKFLVVAVSLLTVVVAFVLFLSLSPDLASISLASYALTLLDLFLLVFAALMSVGWSQFLADRLSLKLLKWAVLFASGTKFFLTFAGLYILITVFHADYKHIILGAFIGFVVFVTSIILSFIKERMGNNQIKPLTDN